MRFLHYSTYDIRGGAAMAAYKTHDFLRRAGHTSHMAVAHKHSHDKDVIEAPVSSCHYRICKLSRWLRYLKFPRQRTRCHTFNLDYKLPYRSADLCPIDASEVDVICLGWITNFLSVRSIRSICDHYRKPVLWAFMDDEPITGGCHYTLDCARYEQSCGNCPELVPGRENDRSRVVWKRKHKLLSGMPIAFWVGHKEAQEKIRRSSLFSEHRTVILNPGFDESVLRPIDKRIARDLLHIPVDAKVIFFGATMLDEKRKGIDLLLEALESLHSRMGADASRVFVAFAGIGGEDIGSRIRFRNKWLGLLGDQLSLALAYQAADIYVCPSIADAGPMMVPEAMLCGVPVVAFAQGHAKELVDTMNTGVLCEEISVEALAHGLLTALQSDKLAEMGEESAKRALARFSREGFVKRFTGACAELL